MENARDEARVSTQGRQLPNPDFERRTQTGSGPWVRGRGHGGQGLRDLGSGG